MHNARCHYLHARGKYIEQKFKIQKQQQPFYKILELILLKKEKKYKKNNTKSSNIHTHETAQHNEPVNKNRELQRAQTLRTL